MSENEVHDFFVEYNLFPRYDSMDIGYDILDADGCIVATLKDNTTYADCIMTIKYLEASNARTRTISFFKEIIKDPGFQFGFLVGFLTGIGMIIVSAIMAN